MHTEISPMLEMINYRIRNSVKTFKTCYLTIRKGIYQRDKKIFYKVIKYN